MGAAATAGSDILTGDNLKKVLDDWAEETLANIGIFKKTSLKFDELKQKILYQLRSEYTDKAIEKILVAADNRKIEEPDGFARITGPCGDTMEIYLKIEDGKIIDASFQTDGCSPSIAAGGMMAEMVKDLPASKADNFSQQDVLDALGGLPEENEHCALLAVNTLNEALKHRSGPAPTI
jgi:nitrogen fixation protein NifU and related proteins